MLPNSLPNSLHLPTGAALSDAAHISDADAGGDKGLLMLPNPLYSPWQGKAPTINDIQPASPTLCTASAQPTEKRATYCC
jgi:hypothetical protein